jgi:hypothetical protein
LHGLIDVERLRNVCGNRAYDANRSGSEGQKSGPSRPQVGPVSWSSRGTEWPAVTGFKEESAPEPENGADWETEENPVIVAARVNGRAETVAAEVK